MCDPVTMMVIGLGATAASTAINYAGQRKTEQAREEAANFARQQAFREEERQRQQRRQAEELHSQSVQQHTRAEYDKGLEQETARLTKAIEPDATQTTLADTMLSGQSLGSEVVKEDAARQMSNAVNEAKQRAARLAQLSAYGPVGAARGIGRDDANAQLAVLNNMRAGGLAATRLGTQGIMANLPQYKGNPLADLLGGVGSMALFGAGQGIGSAAGGATGLAGANQGLSATMFGSQLGINPAGQQAQMLAAQTPFFW